jgi:Holliday junction resolvase
MVDSRQKGARAESEAKGVLRKYTGLQWERVPGSGALSAAHKLKGDLYVPEAKNVYCIEVKHYKEDHISSKILTDKNPQISKWWEQAERQATQVEQKPLLLFKFDRSKWFVAFRDQTNSIDYRWLHYNSDNIIIAKLEDWLTFEKPKFIV